MKILVIHPVKRGVLDEDPMPPLPPFIEVESRWLSRGPTSIECRADKARAVPGVLDLVTESRAEGFDGIVVNCFMEPGLAAARELTHVPVVGPAQSAMTLATTLGGRFSVILPSGSGAPIAAEQARRYVGSERLASVRSVEMPVAELGDTERLTAGLIEQAERAVSEDRAHVVILGCTGMCATTTAVSAVVSSRGVPVIDPTLAAIGAITAQVCAGVSHSPRAYAMPRWRTDAA
ncbi:allantoin racemase [Micromonospora rhizosphaerae]|uniref:Allantoin racemase n=1 Tax=Micromonospora rhizosphaerae TaxID=568872 RepID=A0A1C6T3L7_9ACTN|nr:aspartate/glutamate racemase family protein [Micromonospora rhizosphaerae]SCL36420.1 allantoin racemase [Micromonospora rhizosphaerae]